MLFCRMFIALNKSIMERFGYISLLLRYCRSSFSKANLFMRCRIQQSLLLNWMRNTQELHKWSVFHITASHLCSAVSNGMKI